MCSHTHTHTCTHITQCTLGNQRTTWRNCYSLSSAWILGMELRSSGLAASTFHHWAILLLLRHDFLFPNLNFLIWKMGKPMVALRTVPSHKWNKIRKMLRRQQPPCSDTWTTLTFTVPEVRPLGSLKSMSKALRMFCRISLHCYAFLGC